MSDLTLDTIEAALRDGSLESANKATLNPYLRAFHALPKNGSSGYQMRLEQVAQTLRHLIALADARESNRRTICWAMIAGVAGIFAAVFAGIAVVQNYVSSTSDKHSHHSAQPSVSSSSLPSASFVLSNSVPTPTNQPAARP